VLGPKAVGSCGPATASCGDAAVIGLQLLRRPEWGVEEPAMARVELNAALAAEVGGKSVSDLSKNIRDTEADVKEGWRKADGDESLGDKAANVGDRLGNAVKDAGDKLHETADDLSRDAAYEEGRQDEAMRPR
jgi:hypothetical protein